MTARIDEPAVRRAYDDRIAGHSLKPLWEVLAALVPAQPATDAVPAL
jgi:gentisate 1,2-dioxygenase